MKRIVMLTLIMIVGGYGAAQAQTMMEMETATERQTAAKDFLGLKWGLGIGIMGGFDGDKAIEKASIVGTEKKTVYVEEEGGLRPQVFLEMHVFLWGSKVKEWRKYQREKATYEMERVRREARDREIKERQARENQPTEGQAGEEESTEEQDGENQPTEEQAGEKEPTEEQDGENQPTEKQTREEQKTKGEPAKSPATWEQEMKWPSMPKDLPAMGFGPFIAVQSGDNKVIDALALGVMWGFRRIPSESVSMNIGFGVSFDPSVQVLAKGFKEGHEPPNNETEVRFKKESQFGWSLMASFTF